ncbi:MAG TPA: hypothetical protein VL860_07540, partial [Planctomycetota bacterium]|nr:hypothetical protein [Planctomycetota bacterium]
VTGKTEGLTPMPIAILLGKTGYFKAKTKIHIPFSPAGWQAYRLARRLLRWGAVLPFVWVAAVMLIPSGPVPTWPFFALLPIIAYFGAVLWWGLNNAPRIEPQHVSLYNVRIRFPDQAESVHRLYCSAFMEWKKANHIQTDISYEE